MILCPTIQKTKKRHRDEADVTHRDEADRSGQHRTPRLPVSFKIVRMRLLLLAFDRTLMILERLSRY
jgi:hypothetical protein